MEDLLKHIKPEKLPAHVAIIMDGNGRWARRQGKDRVFGHLHGVNTVRNIVEAARELEIPYLTLYTFSTENWNRPAGEVNALMKLLSETTLKEEKNLVENQIRLQIIGDLSGLPPETRNNFQRVLEKTSGNYRMTLSLALNYGGKKEIIQAVNNLVKNHSGKKNITEKDFENYLQSGILPDVDLLIRTGGEKRISNFLLWKAAYAELYFTDILWPDFGKEDFYRALTDYQKRERRYGKTSEQIRNEN
jgi:undecaprenyl diphosphate synthase